MEQDQLELLQEIVNEHPDMFPAEKTGNSSQTDEERLIAGFERINAFVFKFGRIPGLGNSEDETQLRNMLTGIKESPLKRFVLGKYDRHNLLDKSITGIEDVLAQDDMGLLDESDIFDLKHVSEVEDAKKLPDYIASRKKCLDFELFEEKFRECKEDIADGKRTLKSFTEHSIEAKHVEVGRFYYLDNIMLYIAAVGDWLPGDFSKKNARLRCIFENGTEGDLLANSLLTALNRYKETSYLISDLDDAGGSFEDEGENESGFIYVLSSRSEDPQIRGIPDLYKIGYCTIPVLERIRGAEKQPTYLMAGVDVVLEMECYGLNPQKTEKFLHAFFSGAKLNVSIENPSGGVITPREWFSVPLNVIEQAVDMLVNGSIGRKRYDVEKQAITDRS